MVSFLTERKEPKRSLERKFHPRPNDYIFLQPRYGGDFSNIISKQKVLFWYHMCIGCQKSEWEKALSKRNNPKLRRAPQGPNGCFAITKRGNLINLRIGLVYWHYTLDCEKKIRLTRKKKKQPKALRGSTGYQWAARVYKRAALVYKRAARPRPQVRSEPAAMTVTQVYDSQRFH